MKITASELRQNLINEIKTIVKKAHQLQKLSNDELNERIHPSSWTVLECIEHLNRYSEFYLEEIEKRIGAKMDKNNTQNIADYTFKSGFIGNYSANSMLPVTAGKNAGKINKMTTFKDKDPIHSGVDKKVLDIFIDDQNEFIRLLEKSKNVNLNKTKTSLTIPILKFNLGDTFRFVINHQIRHFVQIENILKISQQLVA